MTSQLRGVRITAWFHRHGVNHRQGGAPARLLRTTSWAIWMSLVIARHPLSDHQRLGALSRLWAWQVWRRVVKRPIMVELPLGTKLICPTWSGLAGTLAAVGLHEADELLCVTDLIRPQDCVVDVGANLGVYTIIAAQRGASVIAFEPTAAARQALERNARLNGLTDRIEISPLALADFNGPARFTSGLDTVNHLVIAGDADAHGSAVQVATLDAVFRDGGTPWRADRVVLIKVDVEGFDQQVLVGASELIDHVKPVLIVEVWGGGRHIREWLEYRGYGMYRYEPAARRLRSVSRDFSGQGNFIAVHQHRLAWAEERIATASRPALKAPRVRWDVRLASDGSG
jgi:FkbM family methyltransferase